MDREPPGWEHQRLDGSAGKGAAAKLSLSLGVWFDDDGLGWMGRLLLLAMGAWCLVLGAGRKGVDREGDVLGLPAGWLGWAACLSG